ncbi:putative membrane protein YccC [Sphingomonas sp. SORGH_AS 950]|uniref:FUSC family protein n=1 Tax=unclassified Sphingomonas TaxID=196159 RepID=UPI002784C69D|nr:MULTISPECIES: FUSC family protein [unclassified Sphingomonas]MDQ1158211.1 putative membrane protein YccC [Sphingomonas sp. SORGH_AS_0950]MDR6113904.1 putative membrane protein YccC [Sphingomonas sp. SORGH_AS_0789]MDR6144928.1 putative membrane protein YccC [Sphingomonas sp. SORGH_AS_0870]MDR6148736.1 putative membrane protein YccC [Sphingomonas sp. SORGH_AS_0742]
MIRRLALRDWVGQRLSRADTIRSVAFVARCTGAAVLALVVANRLGLDHPVWASVSALVVSQDTLGDTHRSLSWRIVATVIGVGVAVLVALILHGAGPVAMLAVAVGITAAVARLRTELRVCMWTSVIVLLTVPPGGTILTAALARAQEVLLGVAIGAALHWVAERLLFRRA